MSGLKQLQDAGATLAGVVLSNVDIRKQAQYGLGDVAPLPGFSAETLDDARQQAARREGQPVGPQELLDALQFAHFLEQPHHAYSTGGLPGAGV